MCSHFGLTQKKVQTYDHSSLATVTMIHSKHEAVQVILYRSIDGRRTDSGKGTRNGEVMRSESNLGLSGRLPRLGTHPNPSNTLIHVTIYQAVHQMHSTWGESALARLLRQPKSKLKMRYLIFYCCSPGWQCFSRVVYPSRLGNLWTHLAHSYRSVSHPQKRSFSDISPSCKVQPYGDWWVIFLAARPGAPG